MYLPILLPKRVHLPYGLLASAEQLVVDESFARDVVFVHMATMDLHLHVLQLLRARFEQMLPWLSARTRAKVELATGGRRDSFTMAASWAGGNYIKRYDVPLLLASKHRACAKRFAEDFVTEVGRLRGEDLEDS